MTTAVATCALVAVMILTVGMASAQDPREVEVTPAEDFEESREITVRVTGLQDYDGGTAAIYICANADTDGAPIMADAGDCFAPGDNGYVFGPIEDAAFETAYVIETEGIGINEARCDIPGEEQVSCQLVVATTLDGEARLTGVPLDALLVRLSTAELVDDEVLSEDADSGAVGSDTTTQPDELPVTGLSREATIILSLAAGALVYLGYLSWSAASPARMAAPIASQQR